MISVLVGNAVGYNALVLGTRLNFQLEIDSCFGFRICVSSLPFAARLSFPDSCPREHLFATRLTFRTSRFIRADQQSSAIMISLLRVHARLVLAGTQSTINSDPSSCMTSNPSLERQDIYILHYITTISTVAYGPSNSPSFLTPTCNCLWWVYNHNPSGQGWDLMPYTPPTPESGVLRFCAWHEFLEVLYQRWLAKSHESRGFSRSFIGFYYDLGTLRYCQICWRCHWPRCLKR